jgi:hypothetical protein
VPVAASRRRLKFHSGKGFLDFLLSRGSVVHPVLDLLTNWRGKLSRRLILTSGGSQVNKRKYTPLE